MQKLDAYFRWETNEKFDYLQLNKEKRNIEKTAGRTELNLSQIKNIIIVKNKKICEAASVFTLFAVPAILMFIIGAVISGFGFKVPIPAEIFLFFLAGTAITYPFSLKPAIIMQGRTEEEKSFYIHILQKDLPELESLMAEYDVKIEDERQKFEEKP